MSYDQSKRYPESRATQSRPGSITPHGTSRCSLGVGPSVQYLSPPGVSLPAASTTFKSTGSYWGFQSRFYGEALSKSGRQAPGLCIFDRADDEQHCRPCGFAVIEPRAKTWLKSKRMASRWPFGWNIGLIACWPKSSHKPTNFWCPNAAGWLILPKPVGRRC
jgi:hypothetical protein